MRWPAVILALAVAAQAQSVTTVEVYGMVPAVQAYNGLGTNITPNVQWEYQAAQAAHITWGRFDCSWQNVETSVNTFTLPSSCSSAFSYGATYGVHPIVDAAYGPGVTTIASGTLTSSVTSGATTATITITSGSLSSFVAGQTELLMSPQWSSKASYTGALITGLSGNTFTMASAATSNFSSGTAMTVNLLFHPPVLIPANRGYNAYLANASLQAYYNYAHYLSQQIVAAGLTGEVSLWNEPPWVPDPWDMAPNLYDSPPANGALEQNSPGNGLGIELPMFFESQTPVAGAPFDNGYTESSGFAGSIFFPNLIPWQANLFNIKNEFATESFHTYGNNPEDHIWTNNACLLANISNFNNIYPNCTPVGNNEYSSFKTAFAASMVPTVFGGVGHSVTETAEARSNTPTPTETQITRFDMRQFLAFQALGVTPVVFFRMSGAADYNWCTSLGSCYPVYTAFQNLMTDIGTIASSPVAPYSPCMMPRVSSYTGYYPLGTLTFVGSQSGNQANSLLYYTWQRSYGTNWLSTSSPATVNVSVVVPTGLTVSSVKDMVTSSTVTYTFTSGTLTYPVADDPIEVLLVPSTSSTSPSLSCT